MTALEDQQLAGALMWVPPGVVYLAVMLVLLYRWFADLDRPVGDARIVGGDVR
jgi:cytochrome c oxidase assembly factor CtaG